MATFIDRVALALYEAENPLTFEAMPNLDAYQTRATALIAGVPCGPHLLIYEVLKQLTLIADKNDIDIAATFERVQDEQYSLAAVAEFEEEDEDADSYGSVPDGYEDDIRY